MSGAWTVGGLYVGELVVLVGLITAAVACLVFNRSERCSAWLYRRFGDG